MIENVESELSIKIILFNVNLVHMVAYQLGNIDNRGHLETLKMSFFAPKFN
jgi:hypothetical protein